MEKKEDKYSYKGWLISDFLPKRALAVWGHYVIAQLMIAAALFGILIIIGIVFVIVTAAFKIIGG